MLKLNLIKDKLGEEVRGPWRSERLSLAQDYLC